jgi:cytochrome c biogenesis protein CcdA
LAGAVPTLKIILGVVFAAVGAWMAKDYFFLKEGRKVSFAIPRLAHPLIKRLVSQSSWAAVAALALFSSLVELPCTFALPLGYAAILAERSAFPYFYLAIYNLFFVLPLFVIVAAVGFGFSKTKAIEEWREKSKKTMRLVSGLLLLFLGVAFLVGIF